MKMSRNQSTLSNLPDEELLQVLLPENAVRELMCRYSSIPEALRDTCPKELVRIRGIGPIKARQLTAMCEIAKRLYQVTSPIPPVIRSPQDVFDRMADMQYLKQEQFRVLLLNTKSGIVCEKIVSQGTINAALVTPREVFHKAVRLMAASVIIVHNHPSGDPSPSQDDIVLTKKMLEAGKIMDIAVLDHVIIGRGMYVSLKEKGII